MDSNGRSPSRSTIKCKMIDDANGGPWFAGLHHWYNSIMRPLCGPMTVNCFHDVQEISRGEFSNWNAKGWICLFFGPRRKIGSLCQFLFNCHGSMPVSWHIGWNRGHATAMVKIDDILLVPTLCFFSAIFSNVPLSIVSWACLLVYSSRCCLGPSIFFPTL